MKASTPSFLTDTGLKLLLFGGKGGVGKTSCATAAALELARRSPQTAFLLVSTDPAHSVNDCLAGARLPSNLQVTELDPRACLNTFKELHAAKLKEIGRRGTFLDSEDISNFIDLSLPGLDELMAALEFARWLEARPDLRLVVDTAPAGHTLRLVAMPLLLRRWLEALDALLAKHRFLKQLYQATERHDDVEEFLARLSASIARLQDVLCDAARSRFVPVMLAEEISFRQTRRVLEELRRLRIPVTDIIINRLYPENGCRVCAQSRALQLPILERILQNPTFSRHALWSLPLYPEEVKGISRLQTFWDGVTPLAQIPSPRLATEGAAPVFIQRAAQLPAPAPTLWLFAGKGGVGKTTLACATALRLAEESPENEVLLFSTDPAHSLSACLDTPVGAALTPIRPTLTALEVDAEAEFSALKRLYSVELQSFLHSVLGGAEMAFDKEAMERLLDLAPPGLDEVMALTRAMELIDQGGYETLVLDCAPTGHLLRLLEMPNLIDLWLKAFFEVFLKYRSALRLPKVERRLVQLSKQLKWWRALVTDPKRCALSAVTIPTVLALEETNDLIKACERMDLPVSLLFVNLATPPSACPLCQALRRRESAVIENLHETFPSLPQVLIHRCGEPRGLEALKAFAHALYEAPALLHPDYA